MPRLPGSPTACSTVPESPMSRRNTCCRSGFAAATPLSSANSRCQKLCRCSPSYTARSSADAARACHASVSMPVRALTSSPDAASTQYEAAHCLPLRGPGAAAHACMQLRGPDIRLGHQALLHLVAVAVAAVALVEGNSSVAERLAEHGPASRGRHVFRDDAPHKHEAVVLQLLPESRPVAGGHQVVAAPCQAALTQPRGPCCANLSTMSVARWPTGRK